MIILLFFAFISGLVTIAAPCIWPLLPIILSSTATGGHKKPLGVVLGLMVSFAVFTLTLSYLVRIFSFDPNVLRFLAVIVIGFLGLSLVVPALSARLEAWVSRLSGSVGSKFSNQGSGFISGLVTGLALGLIWSPCAGPILATIATLAATQTVNLGIVLVTLFYVLGIGVPLFIFAWAGQRIFTKTNALSPYTGRIQQAFGILMILTAIAIFTNFDKVLQVKLLDIFPFYSGFVNQLEGNPQVKQQLELLKRKNSNGEVGEGGNNLPILGDAPEFVGITNWLNSPALTIQSLKGKVVLVDFWTYTCINCIRTLPFVTSWYDKYKDQGLVVVGVHTPEFEFEKKTENVQNAINQYKIHYPVAQDNNYATWTAYNNRYWPAEYLIDTKGKVRRTHFGEGEYDQTEMAIKELLKEKGSSVDQSLIKANDQTPNIRLTPETYLGLKKMDSFTSSQELKSGYQDFTVAGSLPLHNFAYSGGWALTDEYGQTSANSSLLIHFQAGKVFLVITPLSSNDQVNVLIDGKKIDQNIAGADVKNGHLILDTARLYTIVDTKGRVEDHTLQLDFFSPGIKVFAFTFGD